MTGHFKLVYRDIYTVHVLLCVSVRVRIDYSATRGNVFGPP